MKNNLLVKQFLFTVFLSLIFSLNGYSQSEIISPLEHNAVIRQARLEQSFLNRVSSVSTDTLYLPFFDDFSKMTVWPSGNNWIDSSAFINYNFGINPPTLGVATFDGLDKYGNPYNNTNVNANGWCDTLTSRAINLFEDDNGLPYNISDSLFLTFYYQRKGRGDAPESTDSLVLQFLDPATQVWQSVWKITGVVGGDTTFTRVRISINDQNYRQTGFRFRFRNFGQQTGNLDIWNIDYVSLNKFLAPDYENIRDFAYVYEGYSLLNSYSAVPWKHYIALSSGQQQSLVKSAATLTIRNNNEPSPFPIKIAGTSYDPFGNPTAIIGGGGLNSIQVPLNTNVSPPASLNTNTLFQTTVTGDHAVFEEFYDIGQTGGGVVDDYPMNDTLVYKQDFYNYYAYDDGSAELGYGLSGVGSQLAYKFDLLQPDTLRAVQFFFTQIGLSVTNQLFKLAVWSGSSGPSGSPIYQKLNQTPNYTDSINGFYTYLTDPVFLNAGTYYFGFIQNNSIFLNLGLDVNTPVDQSKKFINVNGSWVNSQTIGMWMIRPVLSSTPIDVGINETIENEFAIYPTPADDIIHLSHGNKTQSELSLSIADIRGRVIVNESDFVSELNVSHLDNGVYFLRITDKISGTTKAQKVVVSHR